MTIKQHPYSPVFFCFCFYFDFFFLPIRLFCLLSCPLGRGATEEAKEHTSFSVSFALPFPRSLPASPSPIHCLGTSHRHATMRTSLSGSQDNDEPRPSTESSRDPAVLLFPSYLIRYCWIVRRSGNIMLQHVCWKWDHHASTVRWPLGQVISRYACCARLGFAV